MYIHFKMPPKFAAVINAVAALQYHLCVVNLSLSTFPPGTMLQSKGDIHVVVAAAAAAIVVIIIILDCNHFHHELL
jgi:hypothetical protein